MGGARAEERSEIDAKLKEGRRRAGISGPAHLSSLLYRSRMVILILLGKYVGSMQHRWRTEEIEQIRTRQESEAISAFAARCVFWVRWSDDHPPVGLAGHTDCDPDSPSSIILITPRPSR